MTGQINQIKKAYQIRVVNMLCDDYLIKWSNSRIEHSIVLERSTLGSFRISIFVVFLSILINEMYVWKWESDMSSCHEQMSVKYKNFLN